MTLETWGPPALLIALSAVAAWLDLTQRRIPNWLCAVTALAGLVVALALGGMADLGSHGLHTVLALLGGMGLFALGGIGGGDAKFYAGVASWFGLNEALALLVFVALSGLLVLVMWFLYRRARRIPIKRKRTSPFEDIPYGIGIGLGAILGAIF